ncbi:hypothetical protein SDRG_07602 [Saprolegnia diclina VS20]|uniref:Uncharacterized protein n=1 Tax=Saprolegnia diclina (strain VS20) TaxID=1156394 RepID=T0RWQ9_SAPDV|nr:hypothetical protein SDRG_07602 [Saprolegnia diclina VS20]EQC34797.1 hypothetical protein SDRG_07602 [Saprolegnia diclina VS20]|eukprot:XP_008611669.1 hypothetical protein SDRG_07602 [Saprolegnia diclina VS20]
MSPREPLTSERSLLRSLDAYESTYGDLDGHAKPAEEVRSLRAVLAAAVAEAIMSPATIHRVIRVLLKRRFGASSRELQTHMLFLAMHIMTKPIAEDAEALAVLYEFMMDKLLPLGLEARSSSPYGSLFFAFALLLRRVEQNDATYRSMVSILKARRHTEAVEFEMDDSMCDVALEKGRLLGGLAHFASCLSPLAPTPLVFDLAHPVWALDDAVPVSNAPLLQAAAYPFIAGFTKEFDLLDLTKSEAEWLTIVELYTPLLHRNPTLSVAVFNELNDTASALSSLFPVRLLPRVNLLAAACAPSTVDAILADLASTYLYTTVLADDVPHVVDAADDAWLVTTDAYLFANDNVLVPSGTRGQKLTLPNAPVLVCWHLATPVWPILLHRLATSRGSTATAILHLMTALLTHRDVDDDAPLHTALAPALCRVGALLHDPTSPLALQQACLAFCAAMALRHETASVLRGIAVDDAVSALHAVVTGLEAPTGQYPSVLNMLQLAAHVFALPSSSKDWSTSLTNVLLTIVTSYPTWQFDTIEDQDVLGLTSFRLVHARLDTQYDAWATLWAEPSATFPNFVLSTLARWFPIALPAPKASVARFVFDDSTPDATPFLPLTLDTMSPTHVRLAATLLACVGRVAAPLVARALTDASSIASSSLLATTVTVRGVALNWPLVCTALLSSPAAAILDGSLQLLTALIVLPTTTTFVAHFSTPQDTEALVTALWELVTDASAPTRQASALRLLALSVDRQPSLVSLLFFSADAAPSALGLLRVLSKAISTQDWDVVANGLDLVRACWPTLFATESALWSDVGATLLCSAVAPDATAHFWAIGIFWQLVALEVTHPTSSSSALDPLLATKDEWFTMLTSTHVADADDVGTSSLPLAVAKCDATYGSLFAMVQFATAMEVVVFKRGSQGLPSGLALAWVCTLASSMTAHHEAVDDPDRSLYLSTSTRLVLTLLHHCTKLPTSAMDVATSVELLKCFLAMLQSAGPTDDDARKYVMTSIYLVLRHMSSLPDRLTTLPSVVVTPLLSMLATATDVSLHLLVLRELVVHWMSPLFCPSLRPCLVSLVSALVITTKVDVLADTITTLSHLLMSSPLETQNYSVHTLITDCQMLGHIKTLAQPLTSAMLRRRQRGYDDESHRCTLHTTWCNLLELLTHLLARTTGSALTSTLSVLAYLEPVLLSAFDEKAPLTLARLHEQACVGRLLLAAAAHLPTWQGLMSTGRLLELGRRHLVVVSGWKQDPASWTSLAVTADETKDAQFQATLTRHLWEVVYLWCVLLLKLTPSATPLMEIHGRPVVDTEAARPILDFLPISMSHATAPCALGHMARLVKCALKEASAVSLTTKRMQETLRDVVEAGTSLLVANFILHEQRYHHPAAYRAELKVSLTDIVASVQADWRDEEAPLVAFMESVESNVLTQP